MRMIAIAIAGIFMIYPAIYLSNIFRTAAESLWTLNVYGELFFGVLPFAIIAGFIYGIFRAISWVTRDKEDRG
jgi:hypothetical protein